MFISVSVFGVPQGDTIFKTIYIKSEIRFNNLEVENGTKISASIQDGDTNVIASGSCEYYKDTLRVLELFSSMDYVLSDYSSSIRFQYHNLNKGCISESFNYEIDTADSTYNFIEISDLEFYNHEINYSTYEVCLGSDSVSLNTDIPLDNITVYADAGGLVFTEHKSIVPSQSVPGVYTILFSTDYCISKDKDSVIFTIKEATTSKDFSIDTLYYCSNGINTNRPISDIKILSTATDNLYKAVENNIITTSGDYLIKKDTLSECAIVDTAYIQLIDPVGVYIESENKCDRAEVTYNVYTNEIRYANWSNGATEKTIELTSSQWINIEIVDMNGCYSFDSLYIEILPFEVESLEFEKEEATCWKDGSISIAKISTSYGSEGLNYTLVNTLNGRVVTNPNNVPDGQYIIQVSNIDNCSDTSDEEITILQKCLEDYPVFSPNQDGLEDEYFIPYEGKIKIYDRNGVFRKELDTPAYWDGTDQNGDLMPMGNYIMVTDEGRPVNITLIR